MKNRLISVLLAATLGVSLLTGCNVFEKPETGIPLSYDNEIHSDILTDDDDYNHDLFYRNDITEIGADYQIIQITDKESTEYGYFYYYATTGGFGAYRSKDLVHWETPPVDCLPYVKTKDSLTQYNLWAPEVIYDEEDDMYYMFFCATDKESGDSLQTFVARAEEPYGPFNLINDGNYILDWNKVRDAIGDVVATEYRGWAPWTAMDPSPFVGADGERYLLVYCYQQDGQKQGDPVLGIYGVRMIDWATPDYSTFTKLASPCYTTNDMTEEVQYELPCELRNEGPFMYWYKDEETGKVTYFLTYSYGGLNDYGVGQAIGDSPLGPFVKPQEEDGGMLLSGKDVDKVMGPGHHSFLQCGDDLYIFYHAQAERKLGNTWSRALCKDRVSIVKNGKGQDVLVASGPTWSLQPQFKEGATYTNIASEATVSATSGKNVEALTDGVLSIRKSMEFVKEFESDKTVTITLDFGEYREITGLMVYNSIWFEKAFVDVDRVEFDFKNEEVPEGAMAYINDLEFDWNNNKDSHTDDVRPGTSAVAVFEPMQVKTIRITFNLPAERTGNLELLDEEGYIIDQDTVAVSEIAVLGK